VSWSGGGGGKAEGRIRKDKKVGGLSLDGQNRRGAFTHKNLMMKVLTDRPARKKDRRSHCWEKVTGENTRGSTGKAGPRGGQRRIKGQTSYVP